MKPDSSLSYESTAVSDIHIIGDSQGTGQPKAGHIANAEAKVCADAVIRLLSGGQPYASPLTNSACYSPDYSQHRLMVNRCFRLRSSQWQHESRTRIRWRSNVPHSITLRGYV